MTEPLIIFIHVPKTAGNTMRVILHRLYGREACFETRWGPDMPPVPHLALTADIPYLTPWYKERIQPGQAWYPESLMLAAARFCQLPDERRARIKVIRGHMPFGLGQYLPQPAAYFTLLRKPADLVLSAYYYSTHLRPPLTDLYEHIAARIAANPQTWILAGPHDGAALLPPDELLERAKGNLRACVVVGLTERFDETLLLLRKAFGWRWPFYVRRNVNRTRPPKSAIPVETLRRIEADHAQDVALYAYAQELFAEQVQQYGPSFERDLERFQALNAAWSRWCQVKDIPHRILGVLDRLAWPLLAPAYQALADWGGLRRLLPARLGPRVVAPQTLGALGSQLCVGERAVGRYRPKKQQWEVQRPWHLFVDVAALPDPEPGVPGLD